MNNFDLRKYLAEGRLRVNEGDMDHLMQDLERELKQHDWFYYMADDSRSYGKGELQQREIKRLLKMLNNSPEAIALYNKYAPVQGGIDLRIKEEKRPDYPDVDKDGDTEESMEKALKDKEANLKEWGSSDWHYFLDAMHTDLGKPTDAPDIFKVLDVAGDAVDKYWDDWEEYKTDYEGLKMDAAQTYLKTKFPEYFKGMQALFAPMNEEYNVGKGMEKDHDFDAMLDHALKLHAGTPIEDLKKVAHDFTDVNYHREVAYLEDAIDMLEAGKHEEFEDSLKLFKDEVEKTIRSFNESIKESLRAWNVIDIDGNVTHEGLSYEEALEIAKKVEGHKIRPTNMMLDEDYDPDQEQLDDEDEIFMPMDDEGRPLEEALNPEVTKAVNRLIKGLAKKYDYSERDAVFAIQAALKQRGFDTVNEDLDIGHEDNEPGMIKADLYKIGKYAMDLYKMMDSFEGAGEVDFPHWWQSKINTAKNMIDGAKHYLEFELKEPTIDATVTEDNLEEIGMFNDPVGYEKSQPETPVFTKEYVGKDAYNILKNGKKLMTLFGSEGEANAYINKRNRELKEEETSFFTKDVKDAVVSKLMDQLKK